MLSLDRKKSSLPMSKRPSLPHSGQSHRALRRLSQSSGGSNPATPSSAKTATTQSAKYWRALCDTNVFHAPFGRPVGDVEEGTIVLEGMRYVDAFDDVWMAVQADDESVVWIRRFATGNLTDERQPEWERVEEAPAPASSSSRKSSTPPTEGDASEPTFPPVNTSANVLAHSLSLVTSDSVFMEYYWDNLHQAADRDWNTEFQAALEDVMYKFSAASVDSRAALARVFSDFADEAEEVCARIVREMLLPTAQRTVRRHPHAMDVYYCNGVMFRMCVDTSGGYYGGDKNALKVASQAHKATHRLLNICPPHFLYVPLVTIMTVNGYRIAASSIPPVKAARRLPLGTTAPTVSLSSSAAGSAAASDSAATATASLPQQLLRRVGAVLGLKEHAYQDSVGGFGTFPSNAELIAGMDHRLYILNTARLFPPAAPSSRCPVYHPLTTPLYQRIRPEILDRCGRPLNPDAFFPGCSDAAANEEIVTITQWLRDEGIPTLSNIIGAHEAVEHPEQETVACRMCSREVSNELRFVACRHEEECCVICSHCYISLMKEAHFDEAPEAVEKKLATACAHRVTATGTPVTAAASANADGAAGDDGAHYRRNAPRCINGLLMRPDVTQLFHGNCVNLRFLSLVYSRLPESVTVLMGKYLEVEMIARAAKHLLWQKLRVAHDAESAHTACVNFYLALLQPEGDLAERFWADDLGPEIQSQFDIFTPFNTAALDIELVYDRVSALTGVELTEASVASFSTDKPFVQLRSIHPVMKLQRIPQLVETVGEHKRNLPGTLEKLLMYWIGVDGDQPQWAHRYPLYLAQRF